MSDIVEMTFSSLPSIFGTAFGTKETSAGGFGTSRPFKIFINSIGNVRSKIEEDHLIKKEIELEKKRLKQPGLTPNEIREALIRLMYCHMLGYDVNFAYISAVKLAQQGGLLHKRSGYVLCALFLHENHELVMLLVNTIQKDLGSSNILHIGMGLIAASQLIGAEMIPALLPLVQQKLLHDRDSVRKKAVICLHAFLQKAPDIVSHVITSVQRMLEDTDPGVMWAALRVYQHLMQPDPASYRHLLPTLVSILQQIIGRKLNPGYEYHTIPAPWLQILILKMIGQAAAGSEKDSITVYPILSEILQRTEASHKSGLAVIYECLLTIVQIHPNPAMMQHATKCVGRFLTAKTVTLKYLGLKALTQVVSVNPSYAVDYQDIVMECLEHQNSTIRRKTLGLLCAMANERNVITISARLLEYLKTTEDNYVQKDILQKISQLTKRFTSNHTWRVNTMNEMLLLIHANDSSINVAYEIIDIIKHISGSSVLYDISLSYWKLSQKYNTLPEVLLIVIAWVLGEFCGLFTDPSPVSFLHYLSDMFTAPSTTLLCKDYILSALSKLCHCVEITDDVWEKLEVAIHRDQTQLLQRVKELKIYASCTSQKCLKKLETQKMDFTLSFLDDFVADALESGAKPYKPISLRHRQKQYSKESGSLFSGLSFNPYEDSTPSPATSLKLSSGGQQQENESLSISGVRKVWGRDGLLPTEPDVLSKNLDSLTVTGAQIKEESSQSSYIEQNYDSKLVEEQIELDKRRKAALASELFAGLEPTPGSETQSAPTPAPQSSVTRPGGSNLSTDSGYNEKNGGRPDVRRKFQTPNMKTDLSEHTRQLHAQEHETKFNHTSPEPVEDWRNISSNLIGSDYHDKSRKAVLSLADDDNSSVYSEDSLGTSPVKKSNFAQSRPHMSQGLQSMYDVGANSMYANIATNAQRTNASASMYTNVQSNVMVSSRNPNMPTREFPQQLEAEHSLPTHLDLRVDATSVVPSSEQEYTQEWLRANNDDSNGHDGEKS